MSANAYELLKSEIVSGKRKPGEIFEEKRFAAQLGVSRISGVGDAKAAKYGEAFIKHIAKWVREHSEEE